MNQQQVLDWVLNNDCYIYDQRVKDDGIYYYVRRNGTKKMAVIYPTKKDRPYTKAAICHICDTLGNIPVPPYAEDHAGIVAEMKSKAKALSDYPKQGMN
jgi:hypothetical protein